MSETQRIVRLTSTERVRVDGHLQQEEIIRAILEVVNVDPEGAESIIETEVMVVSLDRLPGLTTSELQGMIDERKAKLLTRCANLQSLDLDALT